MFVTTFTSFMANISRLANSLICKHIEAMRSYVFFVSQKRSNKTKRSILSEQIFPQLSTNFELQQHNQLLQKVLYQI